MAGMNEGDLDVRPQPFVDMPCPVLGPFPKNILGEPLGESFVPAGGDVAGGWYLVWW